MLVLNTESIQPNKIKCLFGLAGEHLFSTQTEVEFLQQLQKSAASGAQCKGTEVSHIITCRNKTLTR